MAGVKPGLAAGGTTDDAQDRESFKTGCQTLWEEVRNDLTYDKNLLICNICLAMFNGNDTTANHPKDQTTKMSKLCSEKKITSFETLLSALWSEAIRQKHEHGKLWIPRMSPVHTEPPKQATKTEDGLAQWTKARVTLLNEEVPAIQKEINAEHNARNIGSGKVTDHIISQHDFVIRQALSPRQI